MKRIFILLVMSLSAYITFAQDIQHLEEAPSFKGITIGMPISNISNKMTFERVVNGYSIYKLTERSYYSVFNIPMNYVRIIELNGKVHAIEAMKIVKATKEHATVFDSKELDIIQAGLTRQYGKPKYALDEENSKYVRVGVQWISNTKQANCFIDFYGTYVGYKLQFSLSEYREDF